MSAVKTNRGSFRKNKNKEKETDPDVRGSANVAGVDYWFAAWRKVDDTGAVWYSTSYTPKEVQAIAAPPKQQQPESLAEMDDDIPF